MCVCVLQPEPLETPVTSAPRITGSMVTHNDDVVTRMKNVEMIELGLHRIRPWYFSPYPQVNIYSYLSYLVSAKTDIKCWFNIKTLLDK